MDGGISGALVKLAAELSAIFQQGLFWIISYVLGVAMGIRAAHKLKQHNDNPGHHPLGSAIVSFFICAALIALPSAMDTMRETLGFSSISSNGLAYAKSNSSGNAIEGAVYIYAAFFGYIAFIRGLMILNKGAEPSKRGDELSRGFTHLVGAVMATNLAELVGWLKAMFM